MIRVAVIDDSPFIRRMLSDWVNASSDMELVGSGSNGRDAIQIAQSAKPDVITLDIEMPICNGLTALEEIMRSHPVRVVMVSSLTTQGAEATVRALELGAVDFVTKPAGSSSIKIVEAKEEVLAKIRGAAKARLFSTAARRPVAPSVPKFSTDKLVVVASSTGGPKALATFFHSLPKGFPAPILIVQHMPAGFTESFAKRLDAIGTVACKEASHHDRIVPGLALVAPGGRHMVVEKQGLVALNDAPMMHGTKPAADPLFLTALQHYSARKLVGVVLTGMGKDGADGASAIVKGGGYVLGQDEATSTIYGMPKAAKQAGGVSKELPLEEIGPVLVEVLQGRLKNVA